LNPGNGLERVRHSAYASAAMHSFYRYTKFFSHLISFSFELYAHTPYRYKEAEKKEGFARDSVGTAQRAAERSA
jgi:hypothetical protein